MLSRIPDGFVLPCSFGFRQLCIVGLLAPGKESSLILSEPSEAMLKKAFESCSGACWSLSEGFVSEPASREMKTLCEIRAAVDPFVAKFYTGFFLELFGKACWEFFCVGIFANPEMDSCVQVLLKSAPLGPSVGLSEGFGRFFEVILELVFGSQIWSVFEPFKQLVGAFLKAFLQVFGASARL